MSEREDVEVSDQDVLALMRELGPTVERRRHYGLKIEDAEVYARTVLTSDWLAAHVEAVRVSERVRLAERVLEFDASDDYHRGDISEPGYYAALNRAVSLIQGEIATWTDPPALVPTPGVRLTEEA
jgi:hypothetical protein